MFEGFGIEDRNIEIERKPDAWGGQEFEVQVFHTECSSTAIKLTIGELLQLREAINTEVKAAIARGEKI